MPSGAVVTFVANSSAAGATSFIYEATGVDHCASANGTVHLLPEAPPTVLYEPPPCNWPLGILQCASPQLVTITREDVPVTLFLIGRSPHGTDRTTAVVVRAPAPATGTLYQLSSCCDASDATARGAIIQDGDEVFDGSSAVAFFPAPNSFGDPLTSLVFYVRDSGGAKSANATMTITVEAVEDVPKLQEPPEIFTHPRTPVHVLLRPSDAENDTVTVTVDQLPANGKIFLPDADGLGAELLKFSGIMDPAQILRQYAVDVLAASSWWAGSWRWHPLQALGEQGVCDHAVQALTTAFVTLYTAQ
eukprot:5550401-Prymnesium_polylepis.1